MSKTTYLDLVLTPSAGSTTSFEQYVADINGESDSNMTKIDSAFGGLETRKAETDGAYEGMTAGNAEQLISIVTTQDNAPYTLRTSGGSIDIGDRAYDTLVGGTIAWNQLFNPANITSSSSLSASYDDQTNVITFSGTTGSGNNFILGSTPVINGHKYLSLYQIIDNPNNVPFSVTLGGCNIQRLYQYQMGICFMNSTATGTFRYGLGIAANKNITGLKIKTILVDLTQMFGASIANYLYTAENTSPESQIANEVSVTMLRNYGFFTKDYYAYDAGTLQSVNTSAHNMVGFNLFDADTVLTANGYSKTGDVWYKASASSADSVAFWRNSMLFPGRITISCDYKYTSSSKTGKYFRINYTDGSYYACNHAGEMQATETWMHITLSSAENKVVRSISTTYGSGNVGTYFRNICIHFKYDGERDGDYEDYVKHSYALDSSLTLRGIPMLDSVRNTIYYDGDVYQADGSVTRKYALFGLGTSWGYQTGTNPYFYTVVADIYKSNQKMLCDKYKVVSNITVSTTDDKVISIQSNNTVRIRDTSLTSETITNALTGHYLLYEKSTPTTETADPFASPQVVDDWGTEEYVDYAESQGTRDIAVPVGHTTTYPINLRAKLEMAPGSPVDGDNDYIVRQSGGLNMYIPKMKELPPAPEEDGVYELEVTISGDTVTYSWVADT